MTVRRGEQGRGKEGGYRRVLEGIWVGWVSTARMDEESLVPAKTKAGQVRSEAGSGHPRGLW